MVLVKKGDIKIGPSHFFIKRFFQHENEGKTPRHMPKMGSSATLR